MAAIRALEVQSPASQGHCLVQCRVDPGTVKGIHAREGAEAWA